MKNIFEKNKRALGSPILLVTTFSLVLLACEVGHSQSSSANASAQSEEPSLSFEEAFPTRFLQAIVRGNRVYVNYALRSGESPNVKDGLEHRLIPIILATVLRQDEILRLLIKYHANLETKDNFGVTALMWACYEKNADLVELLILSGANVNNRSITGSTPLMVAANLSQPVILRKLLKAGADVTSTTLTGTTALMMAGDNELVIDILAKAGADIEAKDHKGWTAMFYAVRDGHLLKVTALRRIGARIDIKDKAGQPPTSLAQLEKDPALRRKLLDALVQK